MTAFDVLSLSGKNLLGTYSTSKVASFIASKVGGRVKIRTKGAPVSDLEREVTLRVADFLARRDTMEAV